VRQHAEMSERRGFVGGNRHKNLLCRLSVEGCEPRALASGLDRVSRETLYLEGFKSISKKRSKKPHPRRAGVERRGGCLSRMVWAHSGAPGFKGSGPRAAFSGEPIFSEENYRQPSKRKLGGPKTQRAMPLNSGRVRDARKRKAAGGTWSGRSARRGKDQR
jgi:hypothetical protein